MSRSRPQQRQGAREPNVDTSATSRAETPRDRATAPADISPAHETSVSATGDDSFAARLQYLVASTRRRDGGRWTLNGIARATAGRLSTQQVYMLYTGQSANPTLETIRTLAEVFGVDPDFFVKADALAREHARVEAAFETLQADPHIAFVSRQMGDMSAADKALIVDFVRRLAQTAAAPKVTPELDRGQPTGETPDVEMRQDLPDSGEGSVLPSADRSGGSSHG